MRRGKLCSPSTRIRTHGFSHIISPLKKNSSLHRHREIINISIRPAWTKKNGKSSWPCFTLFPSGSRREAPRPLHGVRAMFWRTPLGQGMVCALVRAMPRGWGRGSGFRLLKGYPETARDLREPAIVGPWEKSSIRTYRIVTHRRTMRRRRSIHFGRVLRRDR